MAGDRSLAYLQNFLSTDFADFFLTIATTWMTILQIFIGITIIVAIYTVGKKTYRKNPSNINN